MDKFTASNNMTVSSVEDDAGGDLRLSSGPGDRIVYLWPAETAALREFFAHERDVELGRWRWPENPDYVVYPPRPGVYGRGRGVQVLNEKVGRFADCWETPGVNSPADAGAYAASRAYFAAHPEPKPWHGAKPGEVWVVSAYEEPIVMTVFESDFGGLRFRQNDRDGTTWAIDTPVITSARRIFPEVSDD